MRMNRLVLAIAAAGALWGTATRAAAPVASSLSPGFSFAEYAGALPVGDNAADRQGTLQYIDEKTIDGLKSWYVFYESNGPSGVSASLTFDAPIVDVYWTQRSLSGSHSFASDAVTYRYPRLTGLELRHGDALSFQQGGHSLQLTFTTLTPGDHIRILTAVPEPGTYSLMAGGLAALLWLARRRRVS